MKTPLFGRGIWFWIALGIVLAALFGRVIYESRHEFVQGEAALAAGKIEAAIGHFDRAAHWYAPGNPYVERAIDQLWKIGQQSEKKNPEQSLLAYDAIRGSIFAIRSLYSPYAEKLTIVNERIAELRAREHVAQRAGMTLANARAYHRKSLQRDERPNTGWAVVVELGFFGWILAIVGLVWKGFDPEGRMHWRASAPWVGATVVLFACWIIGLLQA